MKKQGTDTYSWFTTHKGRQFMFGGVCCAAIGISTAYFTSHTFLLHKYQEIVQMYGIGVPIPVPPKVSRCVEDVMDDMQLTKLKRKFIKPFTVFGFDMFHAGCTHTLSGAIIGIPSNFKYETTADVDQDKILVNLNHVSWNSDDGKKLLESMVLSEEARKFAIGREISYVQTPYVYLNSLYPCSIITFLYGFTVYYNNKLGLLNKPLGLRLILYTLVGLFGFGSWALLKDVTSVHFDAKVDKEMCSLGENYISGGIEFYSKLLSRNMSLRKLMGRKGEKLYTVTGNDQYMLRQLHMPLTYRKEYVWQRFEELKKEKEQHSANVASEIKSENILQSSGTGIPSAA